VLSLADAIIQENIDAVRQYLQYLRHDEELNQLDEYGFTPLIEAAIVENISITQLLLQKGADPNQQDATGGTPLQWAAENNNPELCQLLLNHRADPNACNFSGQPVLVMPTLRRQAALRQLLVKSGADLVFAQDYINTKLLGHIFELIGTASIIDPKNNFTEVDLEGFFLEITLGLISDSLSQFQNHFAARQLRRFAGLTQLIVKIIQKASRLIKYQQYRVNIKQHQEQIESLIREEPLIIPVGYEGHAITFIKLGDIWCKCDRREDSRLFDNIMFYRITQPNNVDTNFIQSLIYVKQTDQFINIDLDQILGLTPMTELKIEAQISGNCSWANVEATIPALFFLILKQVNDEDQPDAYYKTLAINFFQRFREWNKDRALDYCIQRFKESDTVRRASHAELLAAVLFQRCDIHHPLDRARIDNIMSVLVPSSYEYILKNYLRVYYYENYTEAGKKFADLLKQYDFKIK
jgi:hypothetical protein